MNHLMTPEHFPLLFQIALDLFRRPSPSGREDLVRAYVAHHLEHHGFTVSIDAAGNVLATRGTPAPNEGYPLLSFHMDCVSLDATFLSLEAGPASSALMAQLLSPAHQGQRNPRRPRATPLSLRPASALAIARGWLHSRGQFVLGGDDKCGGAIALTLAATTTLPLKIVASVEEEIGCVGIEQVDSAFFEDVAYALVLDRRGANHLIVSIAGHLLCQGSFAASMMRAAAATGLLVYAAEGAFSDALTLSHYIENVVNLSVGYYHPHSVEERVSLADLWHSYQWVQEALSSLPSYMSKTDPFATHREKQADALLCPDCQYLLVAPTDLPEDLQMFICHCAEPALPLK